VLEKPLARVDGWRISDLRGRRRPRLQELLLDNGCAPDSDLLLVAGRVDTVAEQVGDLQLRVAQIEQGPLPAAAALELGQSPGYVLFVASAEGYTLLEFAGRLDPDAREIVLDGKAHSVQRVGRSPLPHDPRRCAYVQPVD
jgi:hypothetical protein